LGGGDCANGYRTTARWVLWVPKTSSAGWIDAKRHRVKLLSPTANAQADEACGIIAIGSFRRLTAPLPSAKLCLSPQAHRVHHELRPPALATPARHPGSGRPPGRRIASRLRPRRIGSFPYITPGPCCVYPASRRGFRDPQGTWTIRPAARRSAPAVVAECAGPRRSTKPAVTGYWMFARAVVRNRSSGNLHPPPPAADAAPAACFSAAMSVSTATFLDLPGRRGNLFPYTVSSSECRISPVVST
jgi:hypothetical protein